MFLPIMELAFAVMIITGLVTQVVIPMMRKTPLFPALHKHGIETKLQVARQEVRIAELEKELANLRKKADDIRREEKVEGESK